MAVWWVTEAIPVAATALLPVVASMAVGIGVNPLLLAVPTALAASCAFMGPVATPPNAIVYGTGDLTIAQMAKAGIWLNLFFVVLLPLAVYLFAGRLVAGA
jgi:sodium-dependent dicarboxylate transporter 2/3/5